MFQMLILRNQNPISPGPYSRVHHRKFFESKVKTSTYVMYVSRYVFMYVCMYISLYVCECMFDVKYAYVC